MQLLRKLDANYLAELTLGRQEEDPTLSRPKVART